MSEATAVGKSQTPNTRDSVASALCELGIRPGATVLVHSSLSSMGWVCGGPVAVLQAFMDVLTPAGTLVMPAFSGDCSEPAYWQNPPVPPAWWDTIRSAMPAFDPAYTPTRGIGAIAETFRSFPGVIRSAHPSLSFAAWGKQAEKIIRSHSLDYSLGEESPLARIYELDGWVLLLGVSYDRNTSFHLAEYRAPDAPDQPAAAPVIEAGKRVWRQYADIEFDQTNFPDIGAALEASGAVSRGLIGLAQARLFRQRAAVDLAIPLITGYRANS